MTEATKIEWADHTFSPWLGCTPVSAACDHCYAADMARRYGWPAYQAGVPRRLTAPSTWKMPHRWNKRARANGVRAKVFPSLCDPFDSEAPDRWRDDLVRLIDATPDLDWLLLTKRPHLAAKHVDRAGPLPRNVWLGVTAETQAMADLRIPQLLEIPGVTRRFVSIEPMLGPIDLEHVQAPRYVAEDHEIDWKFDALATGECYEFRSGAYWSTGDGPHRPNRIDWIIAGGESGTSARPSHPAWFRSLRDQCVAAGVPFFFKQWGEWAPHDAIDPALIEAHDGVPTRGKRPGWIRTGELGIAGVFRVGKKAAGAQLDGREWRQVPA